VRRLGLLRLLGLDEVEALLPPLSGDAVVPRGEVYPAAVPVDSALPPTKVSFFAGCVMATALADIDRATIRVLHRDGCGVSCTSGQGCCGWLKADNGDL